MRPPSVEREAALAACRDAYYGHGKLEILPKFNVGSLDDIATLYTPGVAYSVQEIITRPRGTSRTIRKRQHDRGRNRRHCRAGIGAGGTARCRAGDGTAMFKLLAGIDAIPLCIATEQSLDLIDILVALEPTFGGYNIEDVASPDCFALMTALESRLNVPAIHDDQYGTATVIAAALINAFKVTGRSPRDQRVVINGAGAAGTATFDLLRGLGVGDIIVNDRDGILCEGNTTTPDIMLRSPRPPIGSGDEGI